MRRWVFTVTVGEFAGFCIPATVGALVVSRDPVTTAGALVVAGAGEGAVLGIAQARVLRGLLPRLSETRWVAYTSAAGALAWALGLLPRTLSSTWRSWPLPLAAGVGALLGIALLCSIGAAQWLELRRHLRHSHVWVWANAAAWCVGLAAFTTVTSPLWRPGQQVLTVAVIGVLLGLVMAASMAVITGLALQRLIR